MPSELAVILLNYRTPDLTLSCLASLAGEAGDQAQVVIVDNDSGDGSAARFEAEIDKQGWGSWARVVRSPSNGGFAAGNNIGIRELDARNYLLLNSDVVVEPGAIRSLLAARKARPDAGIIGPSMVDGRGQPDQSTFRTLRPLSELVRAAEFGPLTRLFPSWDLLSPAGTVPTEPGWLGFACVLIAREVIEQVGYLDEGYFLYFEDIDYCRRVKEAGWTVLHWPEARIVHLSGGSSQVTNVEGTQQRAPRYYYEARSRYFAKFHGRKGLWMANALFDLGRCLSKGRELFGRSRAHCRRREAFDVWTNALQPLGPSEVQYARGRRKEG